jgi:multidrug resistance efflux pump
VFDFKISMMAPEGADVAAGAPVLGFDTGDLDHKLLEKKAESESAGKRIEKKEKDAEIERQNDELRLAEATSRWRKASLELDVPPELVKSQQLRESKLNAEDARREMEFLKAKLAGAARANEVTLSALRAQKDAADRRVNEILASIEAMTLKAPRAGTVVYSADWKGSKKKVGDSAWRGERILEIPDLSAMKAEGEVDESDAGKIAVGEKVRLRLEAHPDVEFAGKVASIWSAVQTQSARSPVKIVKLAIDLDVTDSRKMRPGMRFRGTVETGRIGRAILVPKDAVFPTEVGPVAYRRTALGYATRRLTIGARNDSSVEVRAGLDPGDRVALRDLDAAAGSDR